MNRVNSSDQFFVWILDMIIAAAVIRVTAGMIQTNKVR